MKRFSVIALSLLAALPAARAADLPRPAPPPFAPPPAFLFEGLYAGVHLGAVSLVDRAETRFAPTDATLTHLKDQSTGVLGGAHVGYDWRYGAVVYGLRADVSGSSVKSAGIDALATRFSTTMDAEGALRGRVGYAFDRLLIYASGGLNLAHVRHDYQTPAAAAYYDHLVISPTVGVGAEYAFSERWRGHVDYRVSGVGTRKENNLLLQPLATARHDAATGQISVGVSYRFGQ